MRLSIPQLLLAIGGVCGGVAIGLLLLKDDSRPFEPGSAVALLPAPDHADSFPCPNATVVDGDTLRCGEERVRLQGIDAPEMPGHCRPGRDCVSGDPYASTEHLRMLAGRGALMCERVETDSYGRTVARCAANGVDLSCAQIEAGHAVRRYGFILCG